MSSVVCRGLETCLDTRLIEPYVSRKKLSPPKSLIPKPLPSPQNINLFDEHRHDNNLDSKNNKVDDNSNMKTVANCNGGGWNFIQALTNPSYNTKEATEEVYVHPLVKRSASALTSKGLAMCTENLGSETGSDTSSGEISSFSWERENIQQLPNDESFSFHSKTLHQLNEFSSLSETKKINQLSYGKFTKLENPKHEFPPPLTSISGSDSVDVRTHREGGRLIINAVAVSSCRTYFEADRTNGRLRLSVLKDCSVDCDCEINNKNYEEAHDNEGHDDDEEVVLENENVSDIDEYEDEVNEDWWSEDTEGTLSEDGNEIGIREFPRPSRCNESGRGSKVMSNWGPFSVAIS